jgi:RNA polymerase sigma factor (sigma-70 family)
MRDKENQNGSSNRKNNGGGGCDILKKLVLISKEMAGNDDILLDGIRKQNEQVIAEIYTRFFPSVRHYIYRNNGTRDDARDIFNDAIVVLLQKAREDKLNLNCSLKTYIYAVCRNLWLKKINAEKVEEISFSDIEDTLDGASLIEESFFDFNRANLLFQKHLLRLSPTCRKLIQHFLEGKSFKEITLLMNYQNESYARKRKYRCVQVLIRRIKKDPDYNTIYDDYN